jgi:hypothetical protein
MDLEGIVAKWKHGPYLDGRDRTTTWCKILNPSDPPRRDKPSRIAQPSTFAIRVAGPVDSL